MLAGPVFEPLPRVGSGAGDETRTRDINLGKVALYQLSYTRVREAENTWEVQNVNGGFLKFSNKDDGASRRVGSALGLEGDGEGGDLGKWPRGAEVRLRRCC
jgi:hypothetical protein